MQLDALTEAAVALGSSAQTSAGINRRMLMFRGALRLGGRRSAGGPTAQCHGPT